MRSPQRGFTLVELMIVLAIVAIILMYAIPNFGRYTAKKQADSAVTQIVSSLQMARSQAVTSGRKVSVCALNTTSSACGAGNNWGANGWGVVIDGGSVVQTYYVPESVKVQGSSTIEALPNGMRSGGTSTITVEPGNYDDLKQQVNLKDSSMSYTIN